LTDSPVLRFKRKKWRCRLTETLMPILYIEKWRCRLIDAHVLHFIERNGVQIDTDAQIEHVKREMEVEIDIDPRIQPLKK